MKYMSFIHVSARADFSRKLRGYCELLHHGGSTRTNS